MSTQLSPEYSREICKDKYNPNTRARERELGLKSFQGDLEAREQLINGAVRFVVRMVTTGELGNIPLPVDEKVAAGNLGLVEAARRFNPAKFPKWKFISYAIWWVKQSVVNAAKNNSTIRLPGNVHKDMTHINRCIDADPEHGIQEAIKDLGEEKVKRTLKAYRIKNPLWMDHKPTGADAALGASIPDPRPTVLEELANKSEKEFVRTYMESTLTVKEQSLISDYFGLETGEGMTLQELGLARDRTRERMRQIKAKALKKMRNPLAPSKRVLAKEFSP